MRPCLGTLWLVLTACGARSSLVPGGEPTSETDAAVAGGKDAAEVEEPQPDASPEPPDPPPDPVVDRCDSGSDRGFTLSVPLLTEVSERPIYLASLAGGPDVVVAVIEDRHELTFELRWMSETGEPVEPEREGVSPRIAWSPEYGHALAYLDRDFSHPTIEQWLTDENGSSWHFAELDSTGELAGPVIAGDEWVVAWRTDRGVTVRTGTEPEEGGWAYERSDGRDLALAADRQTGITYVALRDDDETARIVGIGSDGVRLSPDLELDRDATLGMAPPLESVQALEASVSEGRLFVQGITARAEGERQSCLTSTPDSDFVSCVDVSEDHPAVALATAALEPLG